MRRIVREAAEDDAAEGSRWLEIQVDPTSYAPFVGGITPALEIVLDEARAVSAEGRIGVAVVVAASRMRHPLEARTLARLAARYAGDDAGDVVGFGLSNDERRGVDRRLRAGLRHRPPRRSRARAARRRAARRPGGHGDARAPRPRPHRPRGALASRTPRCSTPSPRPASPSRSAPAATSPSASTPRRDEVPLRRIVEAGIPVALGADDPLLFGNRLAAQYAAARDLGFDDAELAALARGSLAGQPRPRAGAQGGPRRRRRVARGSRRRVSLATPRTVPANRDEADTSSGRSSESAEFAPARTPAFMLDGR